MASSLFNSVAGSYATTRPSYPPALYDAIAAAVGKPYKDLTVLDVGAGTGIATEAMVARGATVIAVDPAREMLAQLHDAVPGVEIICGDGNALPVEDAFADLVTYAQALHWTVPEQSVPEAMRALRPNGVLAAWWNVPDFGVEWVAAQAQRLRRAAPKYHGFVGTDIGGRLAEPPFNLNTEHHTFLWGREVTIGQHVTMLGTQSYLAALGPGPRAAFLQVESEYLTQLFPHHVVNERYVTRLTIARR
ncbi:MAG TPA: methyltransferase domain-containing protein [Pseudonocardiaceae bacterium]|nr:methyltransferase domain-containing protein [Pseudonocardiaceae bacterium]